MQGCGAGPNAIGLRASAQEKKRSLGPATLLVLLTIAAAVTVPLSIGGAATVTMGTTKAKQPPPPPPPKIVCSIFLSQSNHTPTDKLSECLSAAGSGFKVGTTNFFGFRSESNAQEITWKGGAETGLTIDGGFSYDFTNFETCPSESRGFGKPYAIGWDQAVVSSASSSGTGVPTEGDVIALQVCLYQSAKRTSQILVPGTDLTITAPRPATSGVTYSFTTSWGCNPSPLLALELLGDLPCQRTHFGVQPRGMDAGGPKYGRGSSQARENVSNDPPMEWIGLVRN